MRELGSGVTDDPGDRTFDPLFVTINPPARHLCSRMHKKGASLALTSFLALRHNQWLAKRMHCERVLAQPSMSE
jgi:hypothetical protein